ncbi:MAG TPA: DUF2723 domain-containing protein, partial [Firmicutes bacterium]|nr:DUF2723 domain-containing protein [Bacillota bacterium]
MFELGTQRKILAAFAALFVFYIYLSCIPAAVYHGDNGETITAGYTLGIQHPPGYPLFTLLSKIAAFFPAGDISFRIYLLSAVLSLACFFAIFAFTSSLYRIFFSGRNHFLPSISAALIFSLGFFIWQQSITAKGGIYMLNILFTIILSYICLLMFDRNKKHTALFYLFSFLYGISFTNHYMSQLLMLPAYFFLFYMSPAGRRFKIRSFFFSAAFFFAGSSIYLLLPIRAGTAVLNWGQPDTFERFVQVFTRYQYLAAEGTRSFYASLRQAGKFFLSVFENYAYAGAFFAAIGAFLLFNKKRFLFFFLLGIPLIFLLVVSIYLNLTTERLYIMETYLTPVYFPLSVLAAMGIDFLFRKSILKSVVLSALILLNLFVFFPHHNHSRHFFAYDYNKNILNSLDPNSLLFMTGDAVVFPLWYLKYVKKYRTDVTLAGSAVLPMKWVRDKLIKQNPGIHLPRFHTEQMGKESIGPIIDALIKMNIGSLPLYFSYNRPEEGALDIKHFTLMPKGNVYRVVPIQYAQASDEYILSLKNTWKHYSLRGVAGTYRGITDTKTKELYIKDYSIAANTAGTFLEDAEKHNESLEFFTLAHRISSDDPVYLFNMGNAFFNLNDSDSALEMYRKSLALNPVYDKALYNLAVVHYKNREFSKSLEYFSTLKETHPERTDIDSHINFLQ